MCKQQLERLRDCIVQGRSLVADELQSVREHVAQAKTIWMLLCPDHGPSSERRSQFDTLAAQLASSDDPLRHHMGKTMLSFASGLFAAAGKEGEDDHLPTDNLELERAFRLPKAHQRHIHGRAHAGIRIVYQGPTLALVLDAHRRHPGPFERDALTPYVHARVPDSQIAAERRQHLMRQARSRKKRGKLLSHIEQRFEPPPHRSSAT
jgi:hypothetical protein